MVGWKHELGKIVLGSLGIGGKTLGNTTHITTHIKCQTPLRNAAALGKHIELQLSDEE